MSKRESIMVINQKRIGYLDAAKGIAIICIVLGHSYSYHVGNGSILIPYIYSFHVPIFFVISGILYARRSQVHISLLKKVKELILPYLFWGTAYQFCLGLLAVMGGENLQQQISARVSTVLQLTSGAMWFLPTMFIATILFQLSCIISSKAFRWGICILAFVIGVIAPHHSVPAEAVWRGLVGFSFMTVGYYGGSVFTRRAKWYVWLVLLIVDIGLIHLYGTANLASRSFGVIPLYLAVSLLGSWLCISACNYIESKNVDRLRRVMEQIGKYSIVVLCTHQILLTFLQLADYRFLNYAIQRTGEFEGIIMTSAIMTMTYLLMPVLLRCLGWSFGLHISVPFEPRDLSL